MDEMRGGGDIEDALAYAKAKNVRPAHLVQLVRRDGSTARPARNGD
jgi:hypothetical protein